MTARLSASPEIDSASWGSCNCVDLEAERLRCWCASLMGNAMLDDDWFGLLQAKNKNKNIKLHQGFRLKLPALPGLGEIGQITQHQASNLPFLRCVIVRKERRNGQTQPEGHVLATHRAGSLCAKRERERRLMGSSWKRLKVDPPVDTPPRLCDAWSAWNMFDLHAGCACSPAWWAATLCGHRWGTAMWHPESLADYVWPSPSQYTRSTIAGKSII